MAIIYLCDTIRSKYLHDQAQLMNGPGPTRSVASLFRRLPLLLMERRQSIQSRQGGKVWLRDCLCMFSRMIFPKIHRTTKGKR